MNNYYERDDPTYSGADVARAREKGEKEGRKAGLARIAELEAAVESALKSAKYVVGPADNWGYGASVRHIVMTLEAVSTSSRSGDA